MIRLSKFVYAGVDPSLNGTAIIKFKSQKMIDKLYFTDTKKDSKFDGGRYISKEVKKKDGGLHRLLFLRSEVQSFFKDVSPKIQCVALEGYSYGSRGRSTINIGEWGGQLRLMLWDLDIPFIIYSPSRIKQFVTGKGNAKKSSVTLKAYKKWDIDFSKFGKASEDLTDAYAIGKMLYTHLRYKAFLKNDYEDEYIENMNKYMLDVFQRKTKKTSALLDRDFIKK